MQYSILALAPLMATVYAQGSSSASSSSSSISIPPYENPNTAFLTQTNSNGVITGQPSAAVAVTSQPAVATIPAGLPVGITTYPLVIGNNSVTYFTVSVGSSTTVVLGSLPSGVTSVAGAGSSGSSNSGNDNDNDNDASGSSNGNGASRTSSGASGSATSEGAAPTNMVVASGAMMGVGALIAALL